MDQTTATDLAGKLVAFLETGEPPDGLFDHDVFCDFTPPQWRLQASGPDALVRMRRRSHPTAGTVPRWRADPTPTGFVLEVEERWNDAADDWYCRELVRADVTDGRIRELSVYCTGDWSSAQQARHQAEVVLLRP
ncbi:MAG: hypothetical protein ACXV3C_11310 [Actinomycetes bacterium]